MKTIMISFLFFVISQALRAQAPDTLWTRTYFGNSTDYATVIETADGGYLVAGTTFAFGIGYGVMYALKLNENGDSVWAKIYGEVGSAAHSVLQSRDGGYLLVGDIRRPATDARDAYLVKIDVLGDTLWTERYGGVPDDRAYFAIEISDSGYVVVGTTGSYGIGSIYGLRTDKYGTQMWARAYPGYYGVCVREVTTGGFIIAGTDARNIRDACLIRINSQGDTLWTRLYGGQHLTEATSMEITEDGGYLLVGYTDSFSPTYDFFAVRTDSAGEQLWLKAYNLGGSEKAYWIGKTRDCNYTIAGFAGSVGVANDDMFLMKINSDGDTLWSRRYGGAGWQQATSAAQTADGGFVLCGTTDAVYRDGYYVVKTTADQILPVELSTFDAVAETHGIRLSFSTASEADNERFEILRSTGTDEEFSKIADLPSQGNSATAQHYAYVDADVIPGQTYRYYLVDVDINGTRTEHPDLIATATALDPNAVPTDYALSAYPNPFNPHTNLTFSLPEARIVRISVYDITGRWIRTLVNEERGVGNHIAAFDARDLPSGVYFARMDAGTFHATRKLMLMR